MHKKKSHSLPTLSISSRSTLLSGVNLKSLRKLVLLVVLASVMSVESSDLISFLHVLMGLFSLLVLC